VPAACQVVSGGGIEVRPRSDPVTGFFWLALDFTPDAEACPVLPA
jgi:hypothetical protein